MNNDMCDNSTTTFTTVIMTGMFILSEVLPYINIKGNGVLHGILKALKKSHADVQSADTGNLPV
jgi:hypothetical protein